MSAASLHEWYAQVRPSVERFGDELVVARRVGDGWEVLTGFTDDGDAIVRRTDQGERVPGVLCFPRGMLKAIAEEIKPGPSTGELARLEDALRVERERVNNILNNIWRQ